MSTAAGKRKIKAEESDDEEPRKRIRASVPDGQPGGPANAATPITSRIKSEHGDKDSKESLQSQMGAHQYNEQQRVDAPQHFNGQSNHDTSQDAAGQSQSPQKGRSPQKGKPPKKQQEEKRARRFRDHAPKDFQVLWNRAMFQRFYVLSRTRMGTEDSPSELVEVTGSTGNVYHVFIDKKPCCSCPHAQKGHQCKHMIFVLSKVLNAPYHLVYQLALLSTELKQIFAGAPPIDPSASENVKIEDDPNRKPVEGDCPICFSEMNPSAKESIVWCRSACGQNIHKDCFGMWARTKSGQATCPMCRSPWAGDEQPVDAGKDVDLSQARYEDGYLNVRNQLPGVSAFRDPSTYNSYGSFPYYGLSRRRRW